MNVLKVGDCYKEYLGEEGIRTDISDEGIRVIVCYSNPTLQEIEQFKSNTKLEIRFIVLKDIMFFLYKFGSLSWVDSPYNPHLSKHLNTLDIPDENQGYLMTIEFANSQTGKLISYRAVGLEHRFSMKLLNEVNQLKNESFEKNTYFNNIQTLFSRYSTKELVKMSKERCQIS